MASSRSPLNAWAVTASMSHSEKSIATNGWQPVDMIFVKRLSALPDHYVVLEGNRRLMSLRHLKKDGKLTKELAGAVDPLRVLEVKDAPTLEESRAQVALSAWRSASRFAEKVEPFRSGTEYLRTLRQNRQDDRRNVYLGSGDDRNKDRRHDHC